MGKTQPVPVLRAHTVSVKVRGILDDYTVHTQHKTLTILSPESPESPERARSDVSCATATAIFRGVLLVGELLRDPSYV